MGIETPSFETPTNVHKSFVLWQERMAQLLNDGYQIDTEILDEYRNNFNKIFPNGFVASTDMNNLGVKNMQKYNSHAEKIWKQKDRGELKREKAA